MKILIVDDEYVEIEALTYILKNSSLDFTEIVTASNGRQAIAAASKHVPDIILMDIKMPGISGIEAASVIKDMHPDSKLIFLSAYNYFEYAQEALRLSASDFLIKPVSSEDLINLLSGLIDDLQVKSDTNQSSECIEAQFKQITTLFESELMNYLLFADVKAKQLNEYFNVLNCRPKVFHTIAISFDDELLDDLSSIKSTIIKGRCLKTVKESLTPLGDGCFGNFNKNWLYMLLNCPLPLTEHDLNQRLEDLSKTIKDKFNLSCRISISQGFEDPMSITSHILNVKHALAFDNEGKNMVFPIAQSKQPQDFSSKKEQKLLESIRLGNTVMVRLIAGQFTQWLSEKHQDIRVMRYEVFGLLSYLTKSLKGQHPDTDHKIDHLINNYMNKLNTVENSQTLLACFNDQLLNLSQMFFTDMATEDSPIIVKLCRYIDEHYMNELSLKSLSEELSMNSQYISKLFKTTKSVTFSEYLSDVRIRKAKKLLLETTDTIAAIGLSIGYNDPNYFTRAFKKHEAITPKQYRAKASLFIDDSIL